MKPIELFHFSIYDACGVVIKVINMFQKHRTLSLSDFWFSSVVRKFTKAFTEYRTFSVYDSLFSQVWFCNCSRIASLACSWPADTLQTSRGQIQGETLSCLSQTGKGFLFEFGALGLTTGISRSASDLARASYYNARKRRLCSSCGWFMTLWFLRLLN